MECGTAMSLGHNTMATGVVYFHRFYMFHSFKTFPRYVTACCCLLLAGKVEETPKKCRDIIKTARSLLTDDQFYSFGEDPKEEVMTLERILLQTIKFDLQVEHPYSFLVKYAKCLKGDQSKLQKMVQMAWNFVNDSLSTTVCLQWEPEIIAVALIHLATKLSKFTVVDWVGRQSQHQRWWDMFVADVTMEILEDICHQVLDLYQQPNNNRDTPSPPQKPPSKASPPPVKRPITPPSTTKNSPLGLPPPPNCATKNIQDDLPENNSTSSKVFPIEPVPPTRIYPPNYGAIYPPHASSNYGGIPGPTPPPPQPPMYGQQYPPPPQVLPHYSAPAMAPHPAVTTHHSTGPPAHYPPPAHHAPSGHHQGLPPHHQPPLPSHHPSSSAHHVPSSHHGPPSSHHMSASHHPPTYYPAGSGHNRNYYPP